jgi:hypothetical protein
MIEAGSSCFGSDLKGSVVLSDVGPGACGMRRRPQKERPDPVEPSVVVMTMAIWHFNRSRIFA